MSPRNPEAALDVANARRMQAARLREKLRSGDITATTVLQKHELEHLRLYKLLELIPKVGEQKAIWFCSQVPINPIRRLYTMTPRQRKKLIELLEGR